MVTNAYKYHVRKAKDSDLPVIKSWLKDAHEKGIRDSFWVNESWVPKSHERGHLFVALHGTDIIGFHTGRMIYNGILEVRHDWRRKGVGTQLVKHICRLNAKKGERLLYVECKPHSSVAFWKEMGFTITDEHASQGSPHGYRTLEKKVTMPPGGIPIKVTVNFHHERIKYGDGGNPAPVVSHALEGRRYGGLIRIPEAVSVHTGQHSVEKDPVIEIVLDGKRMHLDKCKYDKSVAIGVKRCVNGWYIEAITEPDLW